MEREYNQNRRSLAVAGRNPITGFIGSCRRVRAAPIVDDLAGVVDGLQLPGCTRPPDEFWLNSTLEARLQCSLAEVF